MSITNGYITLQTLKNLLKITDTDTTDDSVLNDLITEASRYIDSETGRKFYPFIQTRQYDTPRGRGLWLDEDLLAIITLSNGDGTSIASTEYYLAPANAYPKYAIVLTESTAVYWQFDSNNDEELAIDVLAWWGFRQDYSSRAWLTGSTLNEGAGLNATDLTFTFDSGTPYSAGQIIKIDNEIMNVSAVSTNDVTVISRGDNGSTAATHADEAIGYIWQPEPSIVNVCKQITRNFYHNRFGNNVLGPATITAAGVILEPEDIPASATKILHSFLRAS